MIFKKNQSKRFHITSIIIGVLFVTVGTIIYSLLYKNKVEEFSYENIAYMTACIEAIMLGIVLVLINFENNLHGKLVLVITGFLIAGFIFNESFRFGIILFVGTMFAYFITMRFKNIFSTVVTMSVCSTIFLVLTIFALKLVVKNYGFSIVLYVFFIYSSLSNIRKNKLINGLLIKCWGLKKKAKPMMMNNLKIKSY